MTANASHSVLPLGQRSWSTTRFTLTRRRFGTCMASSPKIAYVVSRFPRLTETFVLNEVLALKSFGVPVEVFAMRHQHEAVVHTEARQLEPSVHYPDARSVLGASAMLVAQQPDRLAMLLRMTVSGNAGAPRVLAKTLLVLPAAISWAEQMRA